MAEIELKFQVPAAQHAAVQRALATSTAQTSRLRAQYFDTPDRRLAAAGLALRLRQEGRRWVQTLKGRGDGHLQRLEHEVPLVGQRGLPLIDISRHAGTPAGEALAAALGKKASDLQPVFETDVRRTRRVLRSAGASVEVALDVGEIRAGDARLPLCELEFELKSGLLVGLLALAARWVERHALWLDVRSKAERADRLARGVETDPPVQARSPVLTADMHVDAALRSIVGACLAQVLPNAAELAAGVGGPEHLHQARVGLRRLRSALRVFGDWSRAVDAAWQPALAELFTRLGTARDRDVLSASLLPELRAAGAPFTDLPPDTSSDAADDALRAPQCGKLVLELIAFTHGAAPPASDAGQEQKAAVSTLARPCIERLHRQLKRDAGVFLTLDDTMRHRTRKRLKRLRYCAEFVASLYPAKAVKRYLARLRPAQDALGQYNDLTVAEAAFRGQLEHDARAWFALGWLAARRTQLLQDSARALERLSKAPIFWRHAR